MRAMRRERIRSGYIVTFIQYGYMVDHECFETLEATLNQIAYYQEVFQTVDVLGVRQNGRTLSKEAVAEILQLVPTVPPSKKWPNLSNA